MSREKKASEPIKVTDRRLFTADGDIREEFKESVTPVTPSVAPPAAEQRSPESSPEPSAAPKPEQSGPRPQHKVRDQAANPGTPFSNFTESLILQAYMSMGMLRNPYGQGSVDLEAAREMIDLIALLGEKTAGNLTEEEAGFLQTHLGELKLAYVQRSKAL